MFLADLNKMSKDEPKNYGTNTVTESITNNKVREAAQDQRSNSINGVANNVDEAPHRIMGPPPGLRQTPQPPGIVNATNIVSSNNNSQIPPGLTVLPPGILSLSGASANNNMSNTNNSNNNIQAHIPSVVVPSLPSGAPPSISSTQSGMPSSMKPMALGILPSMKPMSQGIPSSSVKLAPPGMPPSSMKSSPPGMPPGMRPPNVAMSPPSKPTTSSILPARTPPPGAAASKATATTTTSSRPGKVWRTQTRCANQPGRLFCNDIPAPYFTNNNGRTFITARPRSELTAKWALPLTYLRNRALRRFEERKEANNNGPQPRLNLRDINGGGGAPQNLTIRDALQDLAVGLFRRGTNDSGSQSAIVSKEILAPKDGGGNSSGGGGNNSGRPSKDYFFNVDQRSDSVFGTVPFYSPRTPGNVVFRLYFEDEPHVTLATGPCIHVVPCTPSEVDQVLRFILSNFKSKKSSGVSSIHSFVSVLQLWSIQQQADRGLANNAYGCLCESRKIVEKAAINYVEKKMEIKDKQEELVEAGKLMDDLPNLNALLIDNNESTVKTKSTSDDDEKDKEDEKQVAANEAKSKLISEEYSVERKWREMQIMYASVLEAVVSNQTIHTLLKKEWLAQIRLEYELWCPFIESFAPNPYPHITSVVKADAALTQIAKLPGDLSGFPYPISNQHLMKCHNSRCKMQQEVMGFIPQSRPIIASAKDYRWKKEGRNFFKELSSAMNELYHDEYAVSDKVWKRREKVRATIEHIVSSSGEFPTGTKVMVFGSSANGFGSPNSDLDLCLQVPPTATNFSKEEGGVEAMTNLASKFEEAGLTDVDTVRLTARIPIVKFNVPYKDEDSCEEILVECDLSLQNPLACLNTSLLHAYSKISPTTCILASIIKRWAKNRDINNPSKHTLSSYGYVIMLLSFLTSRDFDKNGFVRERKTADAHPNPILPNLQLVDPVWAQNPMGPYREVPAKPKTKETMVQHPNEEHYYVNSYFYRAGLDGLSMFCSTNHNTETALGALLASFFHYYAFDFDYKKHIVSLSTKHRSSPLERDAKAEEDGWSIFKPGLAIEDPFELFYDVAHVVKTSNFQHIRKEFSLAYTKIVNAAYKSGSLPTGREILDLLCEPVKADE